MGGIVRSRSPQRSNVQAGSAIATVSGGLIRVAEPGYVRAVLGLVLEKVMYHPVGRDVVLLETPHAMKVFVRHWSEHS